MLTVVGPTTVRYHKSTTNKIERVERELYLVRYFVQRQHYLTPSVSNSVATRPIAM